MSFTTTSQNVLCTQCVIIIIISIIVVTCLKPVWQNFSLQSAEPLSSIKHYLLVEGTIVIGAVDWTAAVNELTVFPLVL